MKSFFIVVVLMLRNGGTQTQIGGAPRAKESPPDNNYRFHNAFHIGNVLYDVCRISDLLIILVGCQPTRNTNK